MFKPLNIYTICTTPHVHSLYLTYTLHVGGSVELHVELHVELSFYHDCPTQIWYFYPVAHTTGGELGKLCVPGCLFHRKVTHTNCLFFF
jgi:hypothetical protein